MRSESLHLYQLIDARPVGRIADIVESRLKFRILREYFPSPLHSRVMVPLRDQYWQGTWMPRESG